MNEETHGRKKKWKVVRSTDLFKSPYLTLRTDTVELPNGEKVDDYTVWEVPDGVVVAYLMVLLSLLSQQIEMFFSPANIDMGQVKYYFSYLVARITKKLKTQSKQQLGNCWKKQVTKQMISSILEK